MDGIGQYTVRRVRHRDGTTSCWIFTPEFEVHRPSQGLLSKYANSTQETYAYSLVDHLNWAHVNRKPASEVTIEDLHRYMAAITDGKSVVYGIAWRKADQRPLGASAARNVATVVRAYYRHLASTEPVAPELVKALTPGSVGTRKRGQQRGEGANPLAPRKSVRRPRFLSDEVVEALFEPGVIKTARDLMIVTWLHDGGLRVGGLCGLRFCDLHLIQDHPCGQRADPHVHVVGRDDNPNRARAKSYSGQNADLSSDGYVVDGVIRAVSPDMISTFYAYLLDDYHPVRNWVEHDLVLIHGQGRTPGAALTTSAVRKMLRRVSNRAGLGVRVTPHAFRHKAAAALYAATDFNAALVAQEFGWARPEMVTELYGRSANRGMMGFLHQVWDTTAGPRSSITTPSSGVDQIADAR